MADDSLDAQIKAITTLVEVLRPLDEAQRANVLDFVFRSLSIKPMTPQSTPAAPLPAAAQTSPPLAQHLIQPTGDIRTLTEQKKPTSVNQMVAVLGYYLAHLAPEGERKDTLAPDDIKKYFVQAGFPLPSAEPRHTLGNAKAAGYLDSVDRATFRLNAVGHNLVAHKLPLTSNKGLPASKTKRGKVKKKSRINRA